MDAEMYLNEIEMIESDIYILQEELCSLFTLATSVTAPTDKEPGGSCGVNDPVGRFGTKLADRRETIETEVERLLEERDRRVAAILSVKNKVSKQVLYLHYVNGTKIRDIAEELHYSPQSISDYKQKGLREIENSVQFRRDLM